MSEDLKDLARQIAREYGIPEDVFLRQIGWESGWNPRARGAAGEMGLGQLMPATAAALGVRDPWDPEQNLRGAARYLVQQYRRFGDWAKALAAYNAGPGAVASGRIPESTRRYVAGILGGKPGPAGSAEPDLGLAGLLARSAGQELFLPVAREPETSPTVQTTGSALQAPARPSKPSVTVSPEAKPAAPRHPDVFRVAQAQLDISAARHHKELQEVARQLGDDASFVAAIRRGDLGAVGRILLNNFVGQLRLGLQFWSLGPSLVSDVAAAALTGQTGEDAMEIIARQVVRALPRGIDSRVATGAGLLAGFVFAMVTDPSNYVPLAKAGKAPTVAERAQQLATTLRRMEGVEGGRELLEQITGRVLDAQTPYERAQALAEVRVVLSREIGSPAASEAHRTAAALLSEAGSAAAMARAQIPTEFRAIKPQAGKKALQEAQVLDSYVSHAVFDGTDKLATLVSRKANPRLHEQLKKAVRENLKGTRHDAGTAAAERLAKAIGAADGTEYLRSIIAQPLEQTFEYLKGKYGQPIVELRGVIEPTIVENLVSRILGKGWAGESLAKSLIGSLLLDDPKRAEEAVSAVRLRVTKAMELHPEAANWYRSAGRQVLVDLQTMGISPDLPEFPEAARRVSAAYAAFSIQTDVPRNALLARRFLDEVRRLGGAEYLLKATPEELEEVAVKVASGKSHATPSQGRALRSLVAGRMPPKVGPFHLAITQGIDDALGRLPRQKLLQGVEPSADELAGLVSHYTYLKSADQLPDAWKGGFWKVPPPIDVWMGRELGLVGSLGDLELSPSFLRVTDGYYRLTRDVGRELGLLPHEVQAAWWAWSRTIGDSVTRVVTGEIPRVPIYAPYTYEDAISRLLYTQIAVEGGAGLKAADLLSGEAQALERARSDADRLATALRALEEKGLIEPGQATLTLGYWKGEAGLETNPAAILMVGPNESIQAARKPAEYLGAVLNQQSVGVSRVLADADYAEAVRNPAAWNAVHQTFKTVEPVEALAKTASVLPDLASLVDEKSLPVIIEKLGLEVPQRAIPKVAAHLRRLLDDTYVQPTRAGLRIVTRALEDPRKATTAEQTAYEIWHTLVNSVGREAVDPHMVPVAERVATDLVEVPESLKKSAELQEVIQRVWRVPSPEDLKSVASAAKIATSGEAGAVLLDTRVRRDLEDVGRWLSEAMRTMRSSDYNTFEEVAQRMYGDSWKALSQADKEALYKYAVNKLISGPGSVWRLPAGSAPGRLVDVLGQDFAGSFKALSEAGRDTLRKFEEQVGQTIQELKRGTVTDEDVATFASKIGLTPADLADIVGPGGARAVASAEEMQAVARMSSEALDRFSRAFSEFMAASQAGNAELVAQAVDKARRELMTMAAARAVTFAVASEAGRSLRYFGRIKNGALTFDLESLVAMAERDPAGFEQFLARIAGGRKLANFSPESLRDVLAEVAQHVAKGKSLPEALEAATGGVKQSFFDALTEWTIAAPLLAPSTSVNNILSTLANLFMEMPVRAIKEVVAPTLGARVAQGEAAAFASTFLTSVMETFPDFLRLMADVLAGRPIVAESKWLEAGRALVPGKGIVGRLKHVAFGSLMAQDAWLTAASARAEYMRLAERRILAERLVREALHGVDDAKLAARLAEVAGEIRTLSPSVADDIARALVSSPDASALRATLTTKVAPDRAPDIRRLELLADPRVDLVEEAREAARRLTWNNDPPLFVADMFRAIDSAPPALRFLARQVFKYVKVPVNITLSFFGDYALAPAKFIRAVAARNPEKASDAAARSLVAYGMFGVGWILSSLGMVDGPGPKDAGLRAAWMSAGHVPNTLRIGNWHISLSGLQPFSYYFTIPAAIRERIEEARATGKPVDEDFIVRSLQMLFRNVILDSSVMASMANIYDAIASELTTPGKLGQAIGGIISGAIPRILAVAAREVDPLEREIFRAGDSMQDALVNQVLYSIPGARQKLPPRLGIFGETVEKGHVPLSPFIRTVERTGDPVAEELFRLGLTVSRPPASVEVAGERVQVPPEIQRLQQIARGTVVRKYLERLIRSPEYAALSDEQKRQVLRAAIRYATPTDLLRQLRETGGAGMTEEGLRRAMGVMQP